MRRPDRRSQRQRRVAPAPDPPPRLPFGRGFFFLVVGGAAALLIGSQVNRGPLPFPIDARLPAVESADLSLVTRLRGMLEERPRLIHDFDEEKNAEDAKVRGRIRALARSRPEEAGLALLRILVKDHHGKQQSFSEFRRVEEESDRNRYFAGELLGVTASPELAREIARAVALRDYPLNFRRQLIVALCRQKHRFGVDDLMRVVLDRTESADVRRAVLLRLHRMGGEPPPELVELLYQPFRNLDVYAAGTLARMGDSSGALLILDGIERFGKDASQLAYHLAMGVNRLTGETRELPAGYSVPGTGPNRYEKAEELHFRQRVLPFRDALAEWLEATESRPVSSFERELLAYRTCDRRRRELALDGWEAVAVADDESLDLASAALLLASPVSDRAWHLERLHRLSLLAGRRLEGVEDEREKIRVLSRLLFQPNAVVDLMTNLSESRSFLPQLLEYDHGNCMGYTTLYLAMADRLDLPLHAVNVPGHVFVRWDDGRSRFNIETTANGAVTPDSRYDAEGLRQRAPRLVRDGVYLGNLTRRQTLALVLANRAATRIYYRSFERAEIVARQACALMPQSPAGHHNLAACLFHFGPSRHQEFLETSRESVRLDPYSWEGDLDLARMLLHVGELELAEDLADRALALHPAANTWRQAILCRLAADRIEEAADLLRDARESSGGSLELPLTTALVEYHRDPSRVTELAARLRGSDETVLFHFFDWVLQRREATPSDARAALGMLGSNGSESKPRFLIGDYKQDRELEAMTRLLRARAHWILGQRGLALDELERGVEGGAFGRPLLDTKQLLGVE